nr:BON domain-containing protein [uncultured Shinella sp.]
MDDRKQASREDDFRDYEQRDIRDGWPYADRDGDRGAGKNAPYGTTDANPELLDNKGVEVTGDPELRNVDGGPLPFSDGEEDTIADDDLEERIAQLLEDDGRFDLDSLEITIRGGTADLDGAVDSEEDRCHLIGLVRRVKGVRAVKADRLMMRGVDSHIPRDLDE